MERENAKRTRIIGLRLTPKEYAEIEKKWEASTCPKLSDYVRKKIFDKLLVITHRNQSLDDFMSEMIKLRTELNCIGNNFNQAVKKLHTLQQIPEFKSWIITHELEKKILLNKVDEIKNKIYKIAESWLQ